MSQATPPGPIRTAILAAFPSARADLAGVIREASGIVLAPEVAGDGSPDVDVTLVDMEGLDGDGALEFLGTRPAVILWESPPSTLAVEPARAHLLRDAEPAEILAAIHAVAAGLAVFDPAVLAASPLAPRRRPATSAIGEHLTDRERDVLQLLADGLTNKAIAHRLGISEHTAKFHVGAILSKLDAESRTEAVTTAARSGLLPL